MSSVGQERDTRPWRQIKLTLPEDVAIKFEEAMEMARIFDYANNQIQAIEAICVEFLHDHNISSAWSHCGFGPGDEGSERYNKMQERVDSGFRCVVPSCEHSKSLHVHHIVPKAQGGSNEPDNLALVCDECHERIHKNNAMSFVDALKVARADAHRQVQKYGHRITKKHGGRATWV